MEMVQEQQLQLKMKFFLGYNMNIVALWGEGGGRFGGAGGGEHFSWWRKTTQGM